MLPGGLAIGKRGAVGPALTSVIVGAMLAGCGADPSPPPSPSPIERPAPSPERPRFSQAVGHSASLLLTTLPMEAGGEDLDGLQVVNDSFNVSHPVDDVLEEVQKKRRDAVAVFRWGEHATIGAITVEGINGPALFEAVVTTWHAPAVIERRQRIFFGTLAWELRARLGWLTVVYRLADVVYIVESDDRAVLEAILLDMPPHG